MIRNYIRLKFYCVVEQEEKTMNEINLSDNDKEEQIKDFNEEIENMEDNYQNSEIDCSKLIKYNEIEPFKTNVKSFIEAIIFVIFCICIYQLLAIRNHL